MYEGKTVRVGVEDKGQRIDMDVESMPIENARKDWHMLCHRKSGFDEM
jgi:hypothetical protein